MYEWWDNRQCVLPLVASCLELWWSSPKIIERSLYVKTAKTLNCARKQNEDNTNLHDEKMRVVDIKTNRTEQVLHPGVVGIDSIDEVFVPATDYNLTERDQNFWLQQ